MKYIILLIFISTATVYAQKSFGVQLGYANIGTNYGYAGLDARLTTKNCLNIGAGLYATSRNSKVEILPEIHINLRAFGDDFMMTELSATNKFINPSIGINLLNVLKIKTGYCLPYQKSDYFKGVTFGVILTLSGYKNGYTDKLNMMQ